MMQCARRHQRWCSSAKRAIALLGLVTLASCGAETLSQVQGTVSVDGAPLDVGTIHFRPQDSATKAAAGAAVAAGRFALPAQPPLRPGKYSVAITGSKKSGKTFADPQRGQVDELVQLKMADSPQEIELTSDNARNLQLQYTTTRSR